MTESDPSPGGPPAEAVLPLPLPSENLNVIKSQTIYLQEREKTEQRNDDVIAKSRPWQTLGMGLTWILIETVYKFMQESEKFDLVSGYVRR